MASYHEGELEVQGRAGVREMAARIGRGIGPTVPPVARHFLISQRFAVLSAADERGFVWATPLTGRPGFVSAPGESLVRVDARPGVGDPLGVSLREGSGVGLLVIDLARRMRMRVNGTLSNVTESGFELETREVYSNCPKYIQARALEPGASTPQVEGTASIRSPGLTPGQQGFIAGADTFFVASLHPERGADASHRGGLPGFVRVHDEARLSWPDYSGNTMFNTLGNLSVNPAAGLLFVEFERGDTLQLTGRALINWDTERAAEYAGAERVVEFDVHEVVETAGAVSLRWRFEEYSPFNPG